jgi:hypothetical protein
VISVGDPGVRAASVDPDEVVRLRGPFPAMLFAMRQRLSHERARRELGWTPYARRPTLDWELASVLMPRHANGKTLNSKCGPAPSPVMPPPYAR